MLHQFAKKKERKKKNFFNVQRHGPIKYKKKHIRFRRYFETKV